MKRRDKVLQRRQYQKQEDRKDEEGPLCRHYVRGTCKHGMLGRNPKDGVQTCKFYHAKTCMKWVNNGASKSHPKGCSDSSSCGEFHPLICKESLHSRTCANIKDGVRCNKGYHLKFNCLSIFIWDPAL